VIAPNPVSIGQVCVGRNRDQLRYCGDEVWRSKMADAVASQRAVLIVEDNPVQLMDAAAALRDAGYEVAEAATVEAAQAHLAARPELVAMVADVDLAGEPLSGFTLAKAVAARWPELAILIVSGVAWPAEEQMPMGARYLRKPFTPEGLAGALGAVLATRGVGSGPH
jgi:DNA-binding NtrC family response regulator